MFQKSIEKNIFKLYIIKFSKWFMLIIPILAMFYKENGLEDRHLFFLQGAYAVSTSVLEIPSGFLADIWGRKRTIILGSIIGAFGLVVYSFSYYFCGFFAAELLLGIGVSFVSGSDSAILYDSLQASGKGDKYVKYEGRVSSFGNIFETIASVFGGILAAVITLRFPFYVQVLISATAIPAAILLVEPGRDRVIRENYIRNIMEAVKQALFTNKKLLSAVYMSSVIGASTLTMAWCVQLYGVHSGFTEIQFTILWVALNLTVALSSFSAYKVEGFLGKRATLILISTMIPAGYFFSGAFLFLAIPLFFIFYIARGIATPVLKSKINQVVESNIRATVLSVRNLVIRLIFVGIGPMIGILSEKKSFSFAMTTAGIVLICLVSFFTTMYIIINKNNEQ